MSIPNIITLLRMVMVPIVVWLIITGEPVLAFWLFMFAGLTDAIDGFIAKQFNQSTMLGAYLDPLADKLLLISIYVTLGITGSFPAWLVILVVSRDILIVLAFFITWVLSVPMKVRPLRISKANTAAQIVLAGVELARLGLGVEASALRMVLIIAVAGLTALSLLAYFVEWARHLAPTPESQPGSDAP